MRQKKVYVLLTTYNHENFIAEAINSILMQKVNFDYEVVIIEDCSQDRTRDIVTDFQKQHPQKVRLVLEWRNQNNNRSWVREIQNADSPYVALLDGDDYWTSPHKLQKQVEFLDQHTECSICFHQAYNLYPDGHRVLYSEDVNYEFNRDRFTLDDVLCQNFLPTCSVVFRRGLFEEFPESFYDILAADWFLHVLNARYGSIGYINENWGVRRVHEGAAVSMKSGKEILELCINTINLMTAYLNYKDSEKPKEKVFSYRYELAKILADEGNVDGARAHMKECVDNSPGAAFELLLRREAERAGLLKNIYAMERHVETSLRPIVQRRKEELQQLRAQLEVEDPERRSLVKLEGLENQLMNEFEYLRRMTIERGELKRQMVRLGSAVDNAEREISALRDSRTWKMTSPLRKLSAWLALQS